MCHGTSSEFIIRYLGLDILLKYFDLGSSTIASAIAIHIDGKLSLAFCFQSFACAYQQRPLECARYCDMFCWYCLRMADDGADGCVHPDATALVHRFLDAASSGVSALKTD